MTNIKCRGNKEIDLLAVSLKAWEKYHIESHVLITNKLLCDGKYSKKGQSYENLLDYFAKEKFNHPIVKHKVEKFFSDEHNNPYDYKKVLVVWDAEITDVKKAKTDYGIEIWFIDDMLVEMLNYGGVKGSRDSILRTIELISTLLYDEEEWNKRQQRRVERRKKNHAEYEEKMKQILATKNQIGIANFFDRLTPSQVRESSKRAFGLSDSDIAKSPLSRDAEIRGVPDKRYKIDKPDSKKS